MPPRLVCLDIDGTLTEGVMRPALAGAAAAVAAIAARLPVLLVTNTTSRSHAELAGHLCRQQLLDDPERLITPATAARRVLTAAGHDAGILLVEPAARVDFEWFREDPSGPAVLLGTEAHRMAIADLQPAFRALLRGARLYTLQRNRYFWRSDELVTDLGPVAAFLGYAAGVEAETLGKPSPRLFETLAAGAGVGLGETMMVGDDAEFDVAGARSLGMVAVLVRTGKYRPGDEDHCRPAPTAVIDSIADLPGFLGIA